MPLKLNSRVSYIQISMSSIINITLLCKYSVTLPRYFVLIRTVDLLPIYYQACKDASPIASGVDLFGLSFTSGPFAVISGASITLSKRYRPQLWIAWCLIIIGLGLMSTITASTSRAASIGYQIPIGIGIGMNFSGVFFPVLAPLPVTSIAPAISLLIYLRNFAQVWSH